MAKSKLPGGTGETVQEQAERMKQAKTTLEEFVAANIKMSQELQKVTEQSSAFFQLAAEGASKVADEMKNIDSSSQSTSQNINGLTKAIEKQGKAFEKANKEAGFKKGGDGRNNVFEQMAKSSKAAKVGITLLTGAFNLLGKAIKGVATFIGGVFDVFTSILGAIPGLIGGFLNFGKSIFESMVQGSEDVRQFSFEVRQALERVKEKFGDTSKGAAADIKSFVSTAVGMYNRFGDSIFASVDDAANFALELAGTGEMATILSGQLKESSNEIIKFAKGMGTTGEESAALMNMAYSSGTDIVDIYKQIGQQSQGLAKRLNLDAKVLAKNIQIAAKDVKHFGKATVQSMSESAAYANKMGLSLDKIVGVLDKFDTFEDAANNVSKLSQAFGLNLDTMKLLEAETPEERLELLKDSFNTAGKSLDNLNRRELNYAASLIGLDEASTKNLLSNENRKNSLDDVKDASSAVAMQTRTMADVLSQATKDIAMNLKQLTRETKGFFDTFIDGVLTGIERTPEMQKIFMNISRALDMVFIAGNKLGAAFVNAFPGVKKMLDALAQFFNPTKIGDMFNGFTRSFEAFFKKLGTGTGDVRELFSDLSKNLTDYFTAQGPAGSQFLQGLKDFWNAIKQVIATAILGIGDVIAEGLSFIADFFEGKRKLPSGKNLLAAAKGGLGKVGEELSPIGEAAMASFGKIGEQFGRIWEPLKESLKTSLKEGIDYIWEYIKEKFSENKGKILLGGLLGFASSGDGGILGLLGKGAMAYKMHQLTKLVTSGAAAGTAATEAAATGGAAATVGGAAPLITKAGLATAGATAGAAVLAIGATAAAIDQAMALSDDLEIIAGQQQSAVDEINDLVKSGQIETLTYKLGLGEGQSGEGAGWSELSNEELVERYGQLIGGASWLSSDTEDAEKIRRILQQKFNQAKQIQEQQKEAQNKLIEEKKKQEKQLKEEAQKKKDEDEYNAFMKALGVGGNGEINMLTFKQKIAEIDKLAKDVTKGSSNLQKNFDIIRNHLKTMNFNLFGANSAESKAKVEEMKAAGETMMHMLTIIKTMALISGQSQESAKQLEKFGDPEKGDSIAGKAVKFVENQKVTIDKITEAFMKDSTKGQSVPVSQVKENMSNLKESLKSAEDSFSSISKVKDSIVAMADPKNAITEKIANDAQNNIQQMSLPLKTLWSTIGSQLGSDMLADEKGVSRMSKIELAMQQTRGAVSTTVELFNELSGVISKLDADTTLRGMSFLSDTLQKFSDHVSIAIDSVSVERINELRNKIAEIKQLTLDLDALMPNQVTVAATPSASTNVVATKVSPQVVKPKQGVQINMKFDIVMDAKSLEKALVTRTDSLVVKALTQGFGEGKVQASPGYDLNVSKTTAANGTP
jgi:hypothetical protein